MDLEERLIVESRFRDDKFWNHQVPLRKSLIEPGFLPRSRLSDWNLVINNTGVTRFEVHTGVGLRMMLAESVHADEYINRSQIRLVRPPDSEETHES